MVESANVELTEQSGVRSLSSKEAVPTQPKIFHRVADGTIDDLRAELGSLPPSEQAKAFLAHSMSTFAHSDATMGYIFISDALGCGIKSGGNRQTVTGLKNDSWSDRVLAPMLSGWPRLLNVLGLTQASGNQSRSFDEAAAAIKTAWDVQRTQRGGPDFGDAIYLVLLSPKDPDDYIALGGRRMYWLDDDVGGGLLHAIDYVADNQTATAPDGLEARRSEFGATLQKYAPLPSIPPLAPHGPPSHPISLGDASQVPFPRDPPAEHRRRRRRHRRHLAAAVPVLRGLDDRGTARVPPHQRSARAPSRRVVLVRPGAISHLISPFDGLRRPSTALSIALSMPPLALGRVPACATPSICHVSPTSHPQSPPPPSLRHVRAGGFKAM